MKNSHTDMKQQYITYNELLNSLLKHSGFKRKDKNTFVKKCNNCIQEIVFIHSVPMPGYKDYNILIGVKYPEVVKIGLEMKIYNVGFIQTNIGYLTSEKNYKVWRIENTAHENVIFENVNDMVSHIERYAIPFLNKYSEIKNFICGIEEGDSIVSRFSDYNLPILYWLNEEKELSLLYLKREIDRKEKCCKMACDDYPFELNGNNNYSSSRAYELYKDFARKFRKIIG